MENNSKFVGGLLPFIGWSLASFLLTIFTLGIAYPWAICIMEDWKVRNTIIDGRQLTFTGTGLGLFGNWIKWWFFSLITFGIYMWWVPIKIEQWRVSNTHFVD